MIAKDKHSRAMQSATSCAYLWLSRSEQVQKNPAISGGAYKVYLIKPNGFFPYCLGLPSSMYENDIEVFELSPQELESFDPLA